MLHINTCGISASLKIWCLSDWINPDWINWLFFLVSPSTLIQMESYSLLVCVFVFMRGWCVYSCVSLVFFLSYNWSWHRQRPSDLINFKHNSSFDSSIKPISAAGSFKLSKLSLMPASYHSYVVKPSFPVSITSLYNNIIELLLSVLLYINV